MSARGQSGGRVGTTAVNLGPDDLSAPDGLPPSVVERPDDEPHKLQRSSDDDGFSELRDRELDRGWRQDKRRRMDGPAIQLVSGGHQDQDLGKRASRIDGAEGRKMQ